MRRFFAGIYVKHARHFAALRNVPVLGKLAHYAGQKAMPSDFRVWRQIEAGEGKGLWMSVNPRTAAELCKGESEAVIQKALARYLRPGTIFYDAGANIGFFTLIGARLTGQGGRVFSFEPDPEIAARLRENAARNGFAWVSIVEAAVYSHSGRVQFGRAEAAQSPDRGTGRVLSEKARAGAVQGQKAVATDARGAQAADAAVAEPEANAAPGNSPRSVTLDDFARENPAPHVVKCDVEGAEVEALRGARQLLERERPVFICEIHSAECDAGVRAILREHGYAIEQLDSNHLLGTPAE